MRRDQDGREHTTPVQSVVNPSSLITREITSPRPLYSLGSPCVAPYATSVPDMPSGGTGGVCTGRLISQYRTKGSVDTSVTDTAVTGTDGERMHREPHQSVPDTRERVHRQPHQSVPDTGSVCIGRYINRYRQRGACA
eukprot:1701793-Rhodomonas_salina.1